jgi:hypothetical protein
MKRFNTFVTAIGYLLLAVGIFSFLFGMAVSNPKIEGMAGRTPLSKYFFSLVMVATGVLFVVAAYKKGDKISN